MQPPEMSVQPEMHLQTHNLQQPPPKVQIALEQQSADSSLKMNEPQNTHINQTQASTSALPQENNFNFEQSHSQHYQDGFRRNNRNSRWGNNNNGGNNSGDSNRNNSRMFGGHTKFNNRNTTSRDEYASNDHDNEEEEEEEGPQEEKSREEVAFDIQFQKWEDQLAEWKRNNANHPDRNQYNDFITKMESCRKQLLQRRASLRQERLDRDRIAQTTQNPQSNPSPQDVNKNQMEVLDQENVSQVNVAKSFEPKETVTSKLFSSERCDSNAAIPGLDLVSGNDTPSQSRAPLQSSAPSQCNAPLKCESTNPDSDSNIVARVNNILGNPEIQSLLSNIQKQQLETATSQSNIQARDFSENDGQRGVNAFNRPDNFGHFDKQQNTDEPQRNPFRHNIRGEIDMSTRSAIQHEMNPKRGRYDSENNDRSQFDRFDRDRNDPFTQVNSTILLLVRKYIKISFLFLSAINKSRHRCKRFWK